MITLVEYLEVQQLAQQGLSKPETARRLGIDRKTVRKYLGKAGEPPLSQKRPSLQSQVEQFEDHRNNR